MANLRLTDIPDRRERGAGGRQREPPLASRNILAINAEGIRKKLERLTPADVLRERHIGTCIVSEIHLREADLNRVFCHRFSFAADRRRSN